MSSAGAMKIGAISQLTGLSPSTLRLWEDQYGLLQPYRTPGGMRLYSHLDVVRALYIRELLVSRGYSLAGIAQIMNEGRHRNLELLDWIAELEASESLSNRVRDALRRTRRFLEDAYLRDATNQDLIREAGLRRKIYEVVSTVAQAPDLEAAARLLVAGTRETTGAATSAFALVDQAAGAVTMQVVDRGERPRRLEEPAHQLNQYLFDEWLSSLRQLRPFELAEVPSQPRGVIGKRLANLQLKSLLAHPLTAGNHLVGLLSITSRQAHGISNEARFIVERVAMFAGPAIGYFAATERPLTSAPAG